MTVPLSARAAVLRIREQIEDVEGDSFTSTQILDAVDRSLQPIFSRLRQAGQRYEMDVLSVPVSSLTLAGADRYEFQLPWYVASIEYVEGERAGIQRRDEIVMAEHGWKEAASGAVRHYSRRRELTFLGKVTAYTNVILWYVRAWPPMHYGLAQAATSVGTFRFGASTEGNVIQRPGAYVGLEIEINNDTPPGMQDEIVRIASYAGGTTRECTLTSPLPAIATAQTAYSLLLPIDTEFSDYLIEVAVDLLLRGRGDITQSAANRERRQKLEFDFETAIQARDMGAPARIWNNGE